MVVLHAVNDEDDTTEEPVGDGGGMEEGDGGKDPVAAGGADIIIRPGRIITHGEPGVWTLHSAGIFVKLFWGFASCRFRICKTIGENFFGM